MKTDSRNQISSCLVRGDHGLQMPQLPGGERNDQQRCDPD